MTWKRSGVGAVAGGLGIVPSAKDQIDTTSERENPSPRPLKPAEAQALMTAELLQAIRGVMESTTALTSRIGKQGALNGVLSVELVTISADGFYQVDYPSTVGSLSLVNHSAAGVVTVQTGPGGQSAPLVGRGVQKVAAGQQLIMPVGERTITIWGTAADQFSLQVFSGLQAYGVGL